MKKKRSTPSKSGKSRDRSPQSGDEIISARDRFKGALQDLLPHSDDETDGSDEDLWASKSKRMALQKKRQLMDKQSELDSNKYVMKLYDRSVDLAQFKENTPLYPICRAWIANQPHIIYNVKKDEPKNDSYPEEGEDTYRLPPPKPQHVRKLPATIPYVSKLVKNEPEEPPSREEILKDNLNHWKKVRRSWMEASARNDVRYEKSIRLLTQMFNKAQKPFYNNN